MQKPQNYHEVANWVGNYFIRLEYFKCWGYCSLGRATVFYKYTIIMRILEIYRFLKIIFNTYVDSTKMSFTCKLNHHHHHVVLVARISLTLSRHSSLSFIALGRSSGQHPVSSHSSWMYVRAGRSAFARPCVGVHKSTSLMSSSLLLQQCPACLVHCFISFKLQYFKCLAQRKILLWCAVFAGLWLHTNIMGILVI